MCVRVSQHKLSVVGLTTLSNGPSPCEQRPIHMMHRKLQTRIVSGVRKTVVPWFFYIIQERKNML